MFIPPAFGAYGPAVPNGCAYCAGFPGLGHHGSPEIPIGVRLALQSLHRSRVVYVRSLPQSALHREHRAFFQGCAVVARGSSFPALPSFADRYRGPFAEDRDADPGPLPYRYRLADWCRSRYRPQTVGAFELLQFVRAYACHRRSLRPADQRIAHKIDIRGPVQFYVFATHDLILRSWILAAALSFRVMGVMAIAFAATSGYFAAPTLRIVGWRFLDVERLLGVFVGSARPALANARRSLC